MKESEKEEESTTESYSFRFKIQQLHCSIEENIISNKVNCFI